jgi:hypothetical protein
MKIFHQFFAREEHALKGVNGKKHLPTRDLTNGDRDFGAEVPMLRVRDNTKTSLSTEFSFYVPARSAEQGEVSVLLLPQNSRND